MFKSFSGRAFTVLGLLLVVMQFVVAIDADAHPHRKKKKRHHYNDDYSYSSGSSGSSSRDSEVTVTIHQLIALDKADAFSSEDFYARVTIGGQVFKSEPIKQTDGIIPNWKFTAVVPSGRTDVKIEVFDKDLQVDDQIDINRINPKRDLDFVINTRACRIEGMAEPYRCGTDVRRAGSERKKAEMVFMVQAK